MNAFKFVYLLKFQDQICDHSHAFQDLILTVLQEVCEWEQSFMICILFFASLVSSACLWLMLLLLYALSCISELNCGM